MTEFCPECGARLDGTKEAPIQDPCFGDPLPYIIVGQDARRLAPNEQVLLNVLRCRFGRPVQYGFLQDALFRRKDEREDDNAGLRVYIGRLRRKLIGTPFQILNKPSFGYGLFWRKDAAMRPR